MVLIHTPPLVHAFSTSLALRPPQLEYLNIASVYIGLKLTVKVPPHCETTADIFVGHIEKQFTVLFQSHLCYVFFCPGTTTCGIHRLTEGVAWSCRREQGSRYYDTVHAVTLQA